MQTTKNSWDTSPGKGDKAALLVQKEFKTATTPFEEDLVLIWQEILNCENVSVEDNFFELGGNTFLLSDLITKISQIYKLSFTFKELLATKLTVKKQANLIEFIMLEQVEQVGSDELNTLLKVLQENIFELPEENYEDVLSIVNM